MLSAASRVPPGPGRSGIAFLRGASDMPDPAPVEGNRPTVDLAWREAPAGKACRAAGLRRAGAERPVFVEIRGSINGFPRAGIRIPGVRIRIPGFGKRISGAGIRYRGAGKRFSAGGIRIRGAGIRIRAPEIRYRALGIRIREAGKRIRAAEFEFLEGGGPTSRAAGGS